MVIVKLFVNDPQFEPDSKMMFLYPMNTQEFLHNQFHIHQVLRKNNIPIYMQPQEFLDNYQPKFLMLQLYYIWCKFKNSQPLYGMPGQNQGPPQLVFRDQARVK
mmetsp:Transcript_16014/g.24837  ORF Transcript_16014/g.24837 Transcript_16014/m.24837 type:complete len:104 (-) Transcript_16014:1818-2129(-)